MRRLTTQARGDAIEFVHDEIGFNYRLSNLHAALGVAQLEQLDAFVEDKRATAAFYQQALGRVDGVRPFVETAVGALDVLDGLGPARRAPVPRRARADPRPSTRAGIQARPLWRPLHLQPAFRAEQAGPVPVAERLYARGLSLPCSVGITPEERQDVVDAVVQQLR